MLLRRPLVRQRGANLRARLRLLRRELRRARVVLQGLRVERVLPVRAARVAEGVVAGRR